jgi:hypothetical protein
MDRVRAGPVVGHGFTAVLIGGWSRSREIFGACGWGAGGGYPVCGAAFGVRAGLRAGLDGGGLPVTPAGLWDLSPFYSLALGPDLEGRFLLP